MVTSTIWKPTSKNVNIIWYVGSTNLGLPDPCLHKNIRAILTNFTKRAERTIEKHSHVLILWNKHTGMDGFIMKKTVDRRHKLAPTNKSIICSLPEDLIIGLFQNITIPITIRITPITPIMLTMIRTIPHMSEGSRNDSAIT